MAFLSRMGNPVRWRRLLSLYQAEMKRLLSCRQLFSERKLQVDTDLQCSVRMTGNRQDARQTDILFVISSLGAGGAERHLASLAAQLQARGWSVAVYSLAGLGGGAAEHYAEGIDLVRPPLEQRPGREIVARRALRFALAVGYLLVTMLRRRPRIIHSDLSKTGGATCQRCVRRCRVRQPQIAWQAVRTSQDRAAPLR
jgi:glycosyl transferase family 4